jgi:hypothetical protein
VGGSLTRHDLGIQQEGPETTTSMKHFILAGAHKDCKRFITRPELAAAQLL